MSSAHPPPPARLITSPEVVEVLPLHALPEPRYLGESIAGRYELLELIGFGGAGFVCSARHLVLDELVALKFLRADLAAQPEAVERFMAEARASYRIQSPHVARVLDVGTTDDGAPFIVMELLIGCDLRELLQARTRLPRQYAIDCVLEICEALAAAHACQIVHRDIKPENVFVVSEPQHQIKVLDFGISKGPLRRVAADGRARSLTFSDTASGTPRYMAPEQIRGALDLDARADIWSVGCVLYEMLSGQAPFDRPLLTQSCAAVLQDEPAPLSELCPELPPGLERVIQRCLQKAPSARYASVADLALALAIFGSRRARMSADRCRKRLQGAGAGAVNEARPGSDAADTAAPDAVNPGSPRLSATTLLARPKRKAAEVDPTEPAATSTEAFVLDDELTTIGEIPSAWDAHADSGPEEPHARVARQRAHTRSLRRIPEPVPEPEPVTAQESPAALATLQRSKSRGMSAAPLFVMMAALMGLTVYYVMRGGEPLPKQQDAASSATTVQALREPLEGAPESESAARDAVAEGISSGHSSADVEVETATETSEPRPASAPVRALAPRDKTPVRARVRPSVPDVGY